MSSPQPVLAHSSKNVPPGFFLVLKKEPLNDIATGKKTIEFRRGCLHWRQRLETKSYDKVLFQRGYSRDARLVRRIRKTVKSFTPRVDFNWTPTPLEPFFYEIHLDEPDDGIA